MRQADFVRADLNVAVLKFWTRILPIGSVLHSIWRQMLNPDKVWPLLMEFPAESNWHGDISTFSDEVSLKLSKHGAHPILTM